MAEEIARIFSDPENIHKILSDSEHSDYLKQILRSYYSLKEKPVEKKNIVSNSSKKRLQSSVEVSGSGSGDVDFSKQEVQRDDEEGKEPDFYDMLGLNRELMLEYIARSKVMPTADKAARSKVMPTTDKDKALRFWCQDVDEDDEFEDEDVHSDGEDVKDGFTRRIY